MAFELSQKRQVREICAWHIAVEVLRIVKCDCVASERLL